MWRVASLNTGLDIQQKEAQTMGLYQHLRKTWLNRDPSIMRQRLIQWRKEDAIVRIDHATRLDRARSLGYKAKPGFVLVRVRLPRGGRKREQYRAGRKSRSYGRSKIVNLNYQTVAEQRANKKYPNCEVLNSYYVAKDGISYWFEIILIDRAHPQVLASTVLRSIAAQRGRVYRGLTSSGKKSRGHRRKGKGAEKMRPSLRAKDHLAH